ncbi:hypothetical protein DEIPH_ctg002orf0128 [Deinococcus phoenicis]|uniref:Uncharacterized protein n=1 Tax=Deinococcus phoenicis TaxID=1476583 RepID=A0A016QV75_9DEIO|nr:hypothetical protein DEIPH_ctg002orf0128 [Deinococcus phoenicis]
MGQSLSLAVHPHPRGEHVQQRVLAVYKAGSSPPTWGTRLPLTRPDESRRFIPTHVGNTPILAAPR